MGFENGQVAYQVKRLVPHGALMPGARWAGLGLGHLVHRHLPDAGGHC